MKIQLPRRQKPYHKERARLMEWAQSLDPTTDEYQSLMKRIDELDRILNRTSELKKTVIPALGGIGGVLGIYALQQFGGLIVPKALEVLATREEKKHLKEFR